MESMEFNTIRRSAMLLSHEGDVPGATASRGWWASRHQRVRAAPSRHGQTWEVVGVGIGIVMELIHLVTSGIDVAAERRLFWLTRAPCRGPVRSPGSS